MDYPDEHFDVNRDKVDKLEEDEEEVRREIRYGLAVGLYHRLSREIMKKLLEVRKVEKNNGSNRNGSDD